MQSKLDTVKEMLAYLVNNNIIKEYEIRENTDTNVECRVSVIFKDTELYLTLHSAYWYLQGLLDAQDLGK